jgi:hypothetical protein
MAAEEHFEAPQPLTELPFAPLTKSHIIHCSYHNWYPKYDLRLISHIYVSQTDLLIDTALYPPKLASFLLLAHSSTISVQTAL